MMTPSPPRPGQSDRLNQPTACRFETLVVPAVGLQIDENENERKEGAVALIRSPVLRKNFFTLAFAW